MIEFTAGTAIGGNVFISSIPMVSQYIQNGLVAMWDGIENAGRGVHNSNTTAWINLCGNSRYGNVNTSSGRQWSSNALVLPGIPNGAASNIYGSVADGSNGKQTSGYTLEACGYMNPQNAAQTTMWPFFVSLGAGGSRIIPAINNRIGMSDLQSSTVRGLWHASSTGLKGRATYSLVHPSGYSSRTVYVNSIVIPMTKQSYTSSTSDTMSLQIGGQFWTQGMEIHSIRLYSRALTADELSHNHAVDVQRFNLPA